MQNEECKTCPVLYILDLGLCIQAAFFSSLLVWRELQLFPRALRSVLRVFTFGGIW